MDTCSICLDDLNGLINRLTTDCNHCFHTTCFLQHVSHNGFNCPNCRNQIIEEPECDDDDESYYDEEEDAEYAEYEEYEEAEEAEEAENGEIDESHLLRGSRWLFRRVEEDDEDDDEDDDDDDEYEDDDENNHMQYERGHSRYSEEDLHPISLFEIGEKIKQCGITKDDMIAMLVFPHKDNAADIAAYPYTHIVEKRRQLDNIIREIPNVIETTSSNESLDDMLKSCLCNNSYYSEFYNGKKEAEVSEKISSITEITPNKSYDMLKSYLNINSYYVEVYNGKKEIEVSKQINSITENTSKMCLSELMCFDIDNDIYKEDADI
jgi:hypothetical protein